MSGADNSDSAYVDRHNDHGFDSQSDSVRLQKVLAHAGVASRRACEQLIDQGRVMVNGSVITEQGIRVNPHSDIIHVDGQRIVTKTDQVYLILNKPLGVHSTMFDEFGRPCIGDIIANKTSANRRLFHVGRLDANTEGLILLTNDGELAHRLMHPSYEIPKTYLVQVKGVFHKKAAKMLLNGIELDDGPARADQLTIHATSDTASQIIIVIHEGRKHIVRRMFNAVNFPVTGLVRTKLGPLSLQDQRSGSLRALNSKEIAQLYALVEM